jgi:hypothetical protein
LDRWDYHPTVEWGGNVGCVVVWDLYLAWGRARARVCVCVRACGEGGGGGRVKIVITVRICMCVCARVCVCVGGGGEGGRWWQRVVLEIGDPSRGRPLEPRQVVEHLPE